MVLRKVSECKAAAGASMNGLSPWGGGHIRCEIERPPAVGVREGSFSLLHFLDEFELVGGGAKAANMYGDIS